MRLLQGGNGRCASSLVGSGALFRSLDSLVELIGQIGNWLSLSNVEDLWGGINWSCRGILHLGGVGGELEVDGLRLSGGRVIGLDVCGGCATNAGGGNCTCRNRHYGNAALRGLRGDNLAMAAGATLNFASH